MRALGIDTSFAPIGDAVPMWMASVTRAEWVSAARMAREQGGRLVSLWGVDRRAVDGCFAVYVAYVMRAGLYLLSLPVTPDAQEYPALSGKFPQATRMERALFDLLGLRAQGAGDQRAWVNHGAWPRTHFPLRADTVSETTHAGLGEQDYAFVRVEGDGVHEIPVGPVHAGIIEPGHFRFSVVGEKVLRLEQRLGYTHKGVEKRFEGMSAQDGFRLAGRVSGDSTVAYAWAYCMALESIHEHQLPTRARWLRALMLERERVANHLGDLGALGNDASLGFGLAQFSRLKEAWLRTQQIVFGHRFMMDLIIPGGVAVDVNERMCESLHAQCSTVREEVILLRVIYDEHAGLQDRFMTTGCVIPELATRLGLCGLAGRASGQAFDLRCDFNLSPYSDLGLRQASSADGDVAARVSVRFEELFESLRMIAAMCDALPEGPFQTPLQSSHEGFGAGLIEGWRGPVFVALEADGDGRIRRCHCHDPSSHNWPVLEHAIIGNIVPDFPLINKSFNLSYSGQDL